MAGYAETLIPISRADGTKRYPDEYLYDSLELIQLTEKTRDFLWAKALQSKRMPDAGQLHVQFAERQKEREGILSARQTVCAPVVDSTEATKFFSIPFSCSKSCSVGNTTCIAPGCDQLLHMIQYRIRFWWKNQAFHELFRLIVQANTPCRLHG